MNGTWIGRSILVVMSMGFVVACSDDDDSSESGTTEETYAVSYDDGTEVAYAAEVVAYDIAIVADDGPMTADIDSRALDYECGQSKVGTCPSITATCEAARIVGATLEYAEADGCVDKSGQSMQGVVVFTRNALRDWTVELQSFERGALTVDGELGFTNTSTGPWSVAITDLRVTGSLSETEEDPACTKSCVKSMSVTADYDVTVSTGTPISVDVALTGDKSVTVSGSVAATGSVTGQVTVMAKGPLGGNQTAVYRVISAELTTQSMELTAIQYDIPPACTCPASGSVETTSLADCGASTVTFSPSGDACPTVDVSYATSSTLCDNTAKAAEMALQSRCVPASL